MSRVPAATRPTEANPPYSMARFRHGAATVERILIRRLKRYRSWTTVREENTLNGRNTAVFAVISRTNILSLSTSAADRDRL